MENDWVIDVLYDLREFAAASEMPELCEALKKAEEVAKDELGKKVRQPVPFIHACFAAKA